MTGVLDLFALANNFTFEYVPIPAGLSGASARMGECLSRIGETVRMRLRVTLLPRESVAARRRRSARGATWSAAREQDVDGAQRAAQSTRDSRCFRAWRSSG
jgi:hypothetical protein